MSGKKESFWIPYADLMTFLMLIFLFISIAFMKSVNDKRKQSEKEVAEFNASYMKLLKDLQTLFNKEFRSDSSIIKLDSANLSIKFINEDILFDYNKSDLKPQFKFILDKFIPKFFDIILKSEFKDKIAEVRIEGHTDDKGDYLYNLKLSQERAREVLAYIRNSKTYTDKSDSLKRRLDYWLTANGYSYGRTLDDDGNLTYYSNLPINDTKSRRVEIRIVTSTETLFRTLKERIK